MFAIEVPPAGSDRINAELKILEVEINVLKKIHKEIPKSIELKDYLKKLEEEIKSKDSVIQKKKEELKPQMKIMSFNINNKDFFDKIVKYTDEELKILIKFVIDKQEKSKEEEPKNNSNNEQIQQKEEPKNNSNNEQIQQKEEPKNNSNNEQIQQEKPTIAELAVRNRQKRQKDIMDEIAKNWETISKSDSGKAFLKEQDKWSKYLPTSITPLMSILERRQYTSGHSERLISPQYVPKPFEEASTRPKSPAYKTNQNPEGSLMDEMKDKKLRKAVIPEKTSQPKEETIFDQIKKGKELRKIGTPKKTPQPQ